MPLWGKTDAAESKPKYLSTADKSKAVFVSAEEAALGTNKSKGITGAGWWLFSEYTDSSGATRYKAENLVAMGVANSVSGDAADDAIVSDVEVTITISAQPLSQDYTDEALTFSVTASASSGSVTYQWQTRTSSTARWSNVTGATSASYTTGTLLEANTGAQYRVVVGSTSGAVKVNSDAATATYVAA